MSSASSSTTAGSNAAAANQSGQQAGGAAGGSVSGPDGTSAGDNHRAEGNVVQPQQAAAGGGAVTTEPPTSSSSSASATSHQRGGPAASGTTGSMGTVLRRKTNVCLICGIYTNLSLNIFEPRNGPNIVDVIYEKYKFRAERGDNADKHICFSCNNWLINWYSLQNTSSGSSNRTYEPAPSTSRSSSSAAADSSNNRHRGRHHHQGHKSRTKRTMTAGANVCPPNDKENYPMQADGDRVEQHNLVSSTTPPFPTGENEVFAMAGLAQNHLRQNHPYAKRTKRRSSPIAFRRAALRESNGNVLLQQRLDGAAKRKTQENSVAVVSSSSSEQQRFDPYEIHAPFESLLIRMLEGQGTSVTKECVQDGEETETARWKPTSNRTRGYSNVPVMRKGPGATRNNSILGLPISGPFLVDDEDQGGREDEDAGNEIVLSFDSALSEVIDVVPSLKAMTTPENGNRDNEGEHHPSDPVGPLRQRLSSGVLSMSIIPVGLDRPNSIKW